MRTQQLILAAALLATWLAASARAEPYLMVRAGAKCNDCHTNMTGGGKRTAFAHIHAHDILHDLELLPIPPGVKGFNGQLGDYVSIGSDLRVRNTTVFQDKFSKRGTVPTNKAFRRSVTSNDTDVNEFLGYTQVDLFPNYLMLYGDFNLNGGVTDREGFALIRGFLPWDTYVKAGRFFPTFGLHVQDDESYITSVTGFTFQNPDEGAEIGIAPGPFFVAADVTNGPSGDKDVSATINAYGLWEDVPVVRNVLLGASYARVTDKQKAAAFYGGANLWLFSSIVQFDLIDDNSVASEAKRPQYAAYSELDLLLFDWLNIRGTFEFLKVANARNQTRYTIGAEPFINLFLQPRVQYRINNGPPVPSGDPNVLVENQDVLFFELHMFF